MDENDTIVLTPIRWKWVLGAVVCLFVPVIGIFLSVFCLVAGFGGGRSLTLRHDGFELRNWGATKAYNWDEVGQFKARTVRYFFVALWSSIVFTPIAKDGKLMTQASKLLSGGSDKIPAIGMNARELADLMNQYQAAYVGDGASAGEQSGGWGKAGDRLRALWELKKSGNAQDADRWGARNEPAPASVSGPASGSGWGAKPSVYADETSPAQAPTPRGPTPRVSPEPAQESIPREAAITPSRQRISLCKPASRC